MEEAGKENLTELLGGNIVNSEAAAGHAVDVVVCVVVVGTYVESNFISAIFSITITITIAITIKFYFTKFIIIITN